jgi:hypothetical protein
LPRAELDDGVVGAHAEAVIAERVVGSQAALHFVEAARAARVITIGRPRPEAL